MGDMNSKVPTRQTAGQATFYDFGYGILFIFLVGGVCFVAGILIDYLWNWLVLMAAQWFLRSSAASTTEAAGPKIIIKRGLAYCIYITLMGIPIDAAYYFAVWHLDGTPTFNIPLQVLLMALPIVLLWLANFGLAKLYLKLDSRQAVTVAIIMAVFTAPWILLILPHL